jgi:hypothetical protein
VCGSRLEAKSGLVLHSLEAFLVWIYLSEVSELRNLFVACQQQNCTFDAFTEVKIHNVVIKVYDIHPEKGGRVSSITS